MTRFRLIFLAILSGLLFVDAGIAGETILRQQGVHEHGAATLHVVVEGKKLHMKLITPAINIVGFEYNPNNMQQKEAVREAIETLEDARKVFKPATDAQCTVSHVEVKTGMMNDTNEKEMHSEFHAQYQFACDAPEKLNSIDVYIFKLFTGTEELDAQIISPKGQFLQELTASSAQLKL